MGFQRNIKATVSGHPVFRDHPPGVRPFVNKPVLLEESQRRAYRTSITTTRTYILQALPSLALENHIFQATMPTLIQILGCPKDYRDDMKVTSLSHMNGEVQRQVLWQRHGKDMADWGWVCPSQVKTKWVFGFLFLSQGPKECENSQLKKKKKNLSSEKPPLYIIRKYPTSKINKRVLDKLNIESPYDPAMPFLDKHTPKNHNWCWRKLVLHRCP